MNIYIDGKQADARVLEKLSFEVKHGLVYIVDITFTDESTHIKTQRVFD